MNVVEWMQFPVIKNVGSFKMRFPFKRGIKNNMFVPHTAVSKFLHPIDKGQFLF